MYDNKPRIKDVLMYLRKSTKSKQERSIEDQESACLELAEYLNLNIIETIVEKDSAWTPNNRPKFKAMLKELSYKNPAKRRAD